MKNQGLRCRGVHCRAGKGALRPQQLILLLKRRVLSNLFSGVWTPGPPEAFLFRKETLHQRKYHEFAKPLPNPAIYSFPCVILLLAVMVFSYKFAALSLRATKPRSGHPWPETWLT